jgi:hypothetical protein
LARDATLVMTAFSARDHTGVMKAWTAARLMRFAA